MAVFLHNLTIVLSGLLLALICLLAARRVRASAIESLRSRLLLQMAIGNTAVCGLLVLTCWVAARDAPGPWAQRAALRVPILIISLAVPIQILVNGLLASRRLIRRCAMRVQSPDPMARDIARLARMLAVPVPRIYRSPLIGTPFVFGRSLKQAALAIPDGWSDTVGREAVLLHELAHLRNRDVGFMTWSSAFLRGWRWLMAAALVCLGVGAFHAGYHRLELRSLILYAGVLVQLRVLHVVILRNRESLADRTVCLLVERGEMDQAVVREGLFLISGVYAVEQLHRPWQRRLEEWLADKAMFAKARRTWAFVYRMHQFLCASHPMAHDRIRLLDPARSEAAGSALRFSVCVAIGAIVGTAAMVLALASFSFGQLVLARTSDQSLLLTYHAMLIVGLPMMGLAASLLALPAWAAQDIVLPTARYLVALSARIGACMLAALIASLQVLVMDSSLLDTRVLAVLAAAWCLLVLIGALFLTVVIVILWYVHRYWPKGQSAHLRLALYATGPGLAILISLWGLALVRWLDARPMLASLAAVSGIAGLAVAVWLTRGSLVSGTDQYVLMHFAGWSWALDSSALRSWRAIPLSLMLGGSGAALGTCFFLASGSLIRHFGISSEQPLILIPAVLIALSAIMIALARLRGGSDAQRAHRIYVLATILRLLGHEPPAGCGQQMRAHLPRLYRRIRIDLGAPLLWATIRAVYEACELAGAFPAAWVQGLADWVRSCEQPQGFGLWPGCSSRLSATYHALLLLLRCGGPRERQASSHAAWIQSLQMPCGGFRGPCSRQPIAEQTFYAVRSLQMLDRLPQGLSRETCISWTAATLFTEGVESDDPETAFYCLEVLVDLGAVNPALLLHLRDWAELIFYPAATTNPLKAAERILYILRIMQRCSASAFPGGRRGPAFPLLAQRIAEALKAELGL